ncbi:hypothetical protein PHIN7_13200 [Polynucleobacter sp. HIN7]|nr:hypothetical protein PHIN7_13200 [Polynucleobacter sp. HIN7]
MVPAELLVSVVAAARVLVREVPFRLIAPVAVIALGRVLTPVPCKVRELMAVVPPTTPPKLIAPEPGLMVSACAPLMVVVEPLKVIVVSLAVRVIAPVDRVIGPV